MTALVLLAALLTIAIVITFVIGTAIIRWRNRDSSSASAAPLGPTDVRAAGVDVVTAAAGRQWLEKVLLETDDGWFYSVSKPRDGASYVVIEQQHPGEWKKLIDEILCSGTKYRMDNVKRFLKENMLWIELRRDPNNEHDPNAIEVLGLVKSRGEHERLHLGYVPKAEAASIAKDVPTSVPLVGNVNFVDPRLNENGNVKIRFSILAPARRCPTCKGDLGRRPRQAGTCKSCGEAFDLTPVYRVVVPAAKTSEV